MHTRVCLTHTRVCTPALSYAHARVLCTHRVSVLRTHACLPYAHACIYPSTNAHAAGPPRQETTTHRIVQFHMASALFSVGLAMLSHETWMDQPEARILTPLKICQSICTSVLVSAVCWYYRCNRRMRVLQGRSGVRSWQSAVTVACFVSLPPLLFFLLFFPFFFLLSPMSLCLGIASSRCHVVASFAYPGIASIVHDPSEHGFVFFLFHNRFLHMS